MNPYKLKFTRLQNEIFRLLCIKNFSLNQRGIAKILEVSPTAVSKAIKGLEKEGLIKIEKSQTMNLISVSLNRENPRTIALKRVENLKQIYDSGLLEYLEEYLRGCTLILFGSYSLGEDTEGSDIDIAVIGSKEKEIDLVKFDKILERTIFLQHYDSLSVIKKDLRQNILNGITLQGVVEL